MEEEISAPKGSILEAIDQAGFKPARGRGIGARIALLKEEIIRAEAMLESKKGSRQ